MFSGWTVSLVISNKVYHSVNFRWSHHKPSRTPKTGNKITTVEGIP
jgi:hypothetical protein